MKKTGTYLASFVVSVLMVFAFVGSLLCVTVKGLASEERILRLARDKEIGSLAYSELEKYFTRQYSVTGIPGEVYLDAVDRDYVNQIVEDKITYGFSLLNKSGSPEPSYKNEKMESNLEKFYSDYAETIGYEKDEKYEKKLAAAKSDAYRIIEEYCDAYKFASLEKHGVLKKLVPLYSRIPMLTTCMLVTAAVLALILLLVNLREKKSTIYWLGASAVVAGALGAVPCIVILATDYISAFTIKQPQIYAAYTGAMSLGLHSFLTASVICAVLGAVLLVVYAILGRAPAKETPAEEAPEETPDKTE